MIARQLEFFVGLLWLLLDTVPPVRLARPRRRSKARQRSDSRGSKSSPVRPTHISAAQLAKLADLCEGCGDVLLTAKLGFHNS